MGSVALMLHDLSCAGIDTLQQWHSTSPNFQIGECINGLYSHAHTNYAQRPDIEAPILNITLLDEANVTPGYIFVAPYQTAQQSIYIYDNQGNLVWSGFGPTGPGPSHNFHVCPINGTDQLCYFTGYQDLGYARGHAVIMNNRFTTIASVQSQGGLPANDQHEFNIVDNGKSALITAYEPTHYDLSAYNITSGQGWLLNSWFQEVEIATGNLLFEWDALSHVPIDQTYVLPNSTDVSGTGLGTVTPPDAPWDYFHINSIDKFANGDYLISARHVSAIYRISASTGNIIWQLGAPLSNFSLDFNFTFQHDARIISDNSTTTILSLFDNASNQFNQSSRYSSGKIISIDHPNNHATLLKQFIPPNNLISDSQGNCQIFDKPNFQSSSVFCGWGSQPYISEYTPDGKMVQAGHFAYYASTMSYRSFKFNYTTDPTDAPAAYVYAHNTSTNAVYYMSWNGATEVRQWRIYSGNSRTGPWESVVGTITKNGFETMYTANGYNEWSLVEAVDGSGNGIRNMTRGVRTFVPGPVLAKACDAGGCPVAMGYGVVNGSASGSGSGGGGSKSGAAALGRRSASSGSGIVGAGSGGWILSEGSPWMKIVEIFVLVNLVGGLVACL